MNGADFTFRLLTGIILMVIGTAVYYFHTHWGLIFVAMGIISIIKAWE